MARHWLVRVDFAGKSYLWSDSPVAPVDADGYSWPHLGGLPELRIPSDFDPWRLSPTVQSVPVEVVWPPEDPIADIIASGHRFNAATAEVAVWSDGDAYDDRGILVSGKPSEPEYGLPEQPVAFSVEARPWVDAGSTHDSDMRVTRATWTAGDHGGDPWYPIVIGRPGWGLNALGGMSTGYLSATPALVVARVGANANRLLIAGHTVESASVTIHDGATTESFTVEHMPDGLGRTVATVDISGAASISRTATEYATAWDTGGGMVGPGGAVSGGGDALLWALMRSSLPVDYGRIYAARRFLNTFKVAGFINKPVSPWDWIQDALLETLLPVSAVVRGGSLRLIPWRYAATASDALRTITTGPGVVTPGRARYETSRIRTGYTMTCAPDEAGENRVTVGLSPDPSSNGLVSASRHIVTASTYADDSPEAVDCPWAGDLATAYMALHWRCVRDLSGRYIHVQDISGEYDDLEDGDIVAVQSTAHGESGAIGLVSRDILSPVAQNFAVLMLPTA